MFSDKIHGFFYLTILILIANSIVFVILIFNINNGQLLAFDCAFSNFIIKLRHPVLTYFFIIISEFSIWGTISIGFVWGLFKLIRKKSKEFIFIWTISFLGSHFFYFTLKELIKRPRPQFFHLINYFGYSFPSGHATLAIVIYGIISYYFHKKEFVFYFPHKIFYVSMFLLVILIGISRIYLGVHYFTDILGGYITGYIWLIISLTPLEAFLIMKKRGLSG